MSARQFQSIAGSMLSKGPLLLPQTTTATLFTVTGLVKITCLIGVCTSVVSGGGITYSMTPNFGSQAYPNAPVAGLFILPHPGDVTLNMSQCYKPLLNDYDDFEIQPMYISQNITLTTNGNVNASFAWYCWWLPVQAGAMVT